MTNRPPDSVPAAVTDGPTEPIAADGGSTTRVVKGPLLNEEELARVQHDPYSAFGSILQGTRTDFEDVVAWLYACKHINTDVCDVLVESANLAAMLRGLQGDRDPWKQLFDDLTRSHSALVVSIALYGVQIIRTAAFNYLLHDHRPKK